MSEILRGAPLEIDPQVAQTCAARAPLVACVLPSLGLGGAEIVTNTIAEQFLQRGLRVDLVCGWREAEQKLAPTKGARHIVLGALRTRGVLLPFASYLRRERPDVVLVSMWPLTTTCALAHRLAGSRARLVFWEHSTLSVQYADHGFVHGQWLRKSLAWSYPLADARIAVSSGVADDLARLSNLPLGVFTVIHNPAPKSVASESDVAAAEAVWRGWRGSRILTVARLKAVKNHALLIRAFKTLLLNRDARLLILGDGELSAETAAFAAEQGVAEKVFMPGAVTNPGPYYSSADLFVLSSNREGMPVSLLEALARGVPVVSTDCKSGPAEILENGRYGRLVPVGDAAALAAAMEQALSQPHDKQTLERRAADFAPDCIAEKFLRVLFPAGLPQAAAVPVR